MAEGKTADGYQPYRYDDPSASLWSAYLSKSEKYDRTMAQNWKGDMDSILIFAGLFSASVTAFIIESYKTLNPEPSDTTVLLLSQISQQLGLLSTNTSSIPVSPPLLILDQDSFSPPISAIICNVLWFLSLGFSLVSALSATLVEQWTRHYLQSSHSKPTPQDRARISAYLYQGVEKYRMAAIVETIPLLLHISLFLFFAGLIAFLIPVNRGLEFLVLVMLLICCLLYIFITALPIFRLSSPYWTPLSTFSWLVLRKIGLLRRRDTDGNDVPISCPMNEARELEAMEVTPERDQRDLKAMCWTLNSLREDNEFEPFVEVIPSVVSGFDYSAKWLLETLLHHEDISIKLGYRIPRLLASCATGLLHPSVAHKRAITCLKAIWSLTMLSMPKPAAASQSSSYREMLKFREDMFDLLFNVKKAIPSPEVQDHILSASIVVARSLLDMQVGRAHSLEAELLAALETGKPVPTRKGSIDVAHIPFYDKGDVLDASKQRILLLEAQIVSCTEFTTPLPHVMMEAIALHHARAASLAANSAFGLDRKAANEILESVRSLQKTFNQAGFNLALEYVVNMLESDTIPHEAHNTIRRTFFRIDFKKKARKEFTKESQERLVNYLEEAVEYTTTGTTRLPRSILAILFGLTRALSEPTLIVKAISIIENYKKVTSDESVPGILTSLARALPRDTPVSLPLDLFSSHLYTDAKPMRKQTKSRANTLASVSEATLS
ncbi:unnamed protein product [Cyclocybe aegerita]|uniref:DUF6535 domain-containing protein n=1 Tax=Cyclocybe aegerita TaxID=1973307 RepID=A0A8S0VW60_CYCAE|nr:unnamed protein product [Cyclocybe aegerita]